MIVIEEESMYFGSQSSQWFTPSVKSFEGSKAFLPALTSALNLVLQ